MDFPPNWPKNINQISTKSFPASKLDSYRSNNLLLFVDRFCIMSSSWRELTPKKVISERLTNTSYGAQRIDWNIKSFLTYFIHRTLRQSHIPKNVLRKGGVCITGIDTLFNKWVIAEKILVEIHALQLLCHWVRKVFPRVILGGIQKKNNCGCTLKYNAHSTILHM